MKKKWTDNIKYEHLVAGLSGGVISTITLHPFDLIKIRFQVNDGTLIQNRQVYNGIWNAFQTIVSKQGFSGLYQGVTPNLAGSASSWGLYFFAFSFFKETLKDAKKLDVLPASYHLLAGGLAGSGLSPNLVASPFHNGVYFTTFNFYKITAQQLLHVDTLNARELLVVGMMTGTTTLAATNPIWVVKTRMCLQPTGATSSPTQYNGVIDGLIKLYKHEGIRGYYRGFVPGLFGCSHGALQFMAYEELKKKHSEYTGVPIGDKLNPLEYITIAALSKVFAVVTTYPYQVIRSRLQDAQLQDKYNGTIDVFKKIYRNEGFHGYYKGLAPSLLRVTPACCITFLVYENVIHALLPKKNETGS